MARHMHGVLYFFYPYFFSRSSQHYMLRVYFSSFRLYLYRPIIRTLAPFYSLRLVFTRSR